MRKEELLSVEPAHMRHGDFLPFWPYFQHYVVLQGLSLPLKPAHQKVCETLQAAVLGKLGKKYIIINIAPRVGKTKILEALTTWCIAYFPDSHVINTSFSSTLAESSTRYVKLVLESAWYRMLFPWVKFGDIQRNNEFTTVQGGHVYGAGVGGTLTGFGAGLKRPAGGFIAIDDPANPNEALSATLAESLQFWFENTILRRRNSSEFTPVIIVAQRLAVNDLPGYILDKYKEDTLHMCFEVIDEEKKLSHFPETISYDTAMKTKAINPFVYYAQLQQQPVQMGGNLIKTDDFMLYDDDLTSVRWERKVIVCDTALKTEEANDFSVIQCWGKLSGKTYLIDQAYGKWESPELVKNFRAFYHKHHGETSAVTRVTVEDKAAGTGLGQTLRREGIPIEPIPRNKDKVTRVQEILPYTVTHMVYLPKKAPWLLGFLTECARFRADGKHEHDDQVDSMCDGIQMTLGRPVSILDVLGGKR